MQIYKEGLLDTAVRGGGAFGLSFRSLWQPQAWYFSGTYKRTYWTWLDRNGSIKIAYYDHDTKETSRVIHVAPASDYTIDWAHSGPSMAIDNNGFIHIFYGAHNSPLKYRKSTNAEDVSSFSWPTDILSDATYPQLVVTNDNTIYMLYRGVDRDMFIIKSTDGGTTWINNLKLFAYAVGGFHGVYPQKIVLGNETPTQSLNLVCTPRPDSAQPAFEKLYFMKSLDGGVTWKKADGTTITLPATVSTADKIEPNIECHPAYLALNSLNQPYVAYALRTSTTKAYKFARWTGSSWVLTVVGDIHLEGRGVIEIDLIDDNTIDLYLVEDTKIDPNTAANLLEGGNVQKWRSTDKGANFTKAVDITTNGTSTKRNFQLRMVHNGRTDLKLFWEYGDPDIVGGDRAIIKSYPTQVDLINTNVKYLEVLNGLSLVIRDEVSGKTDAQTRFDDKYKATYPSDTRQLHNHNHNEGGECTLEPLT